MDISHSFSHSVVAVVTKGTLIYPISKSLGLSHNVTASCSPVTCSWFECVFGREGVRKDEYECVETV